ncbi:helix-turn-helix domain-containing protein [Neisseria sp. Ec49-e6-T10]|uniref:helix-turn-helix domain-containing protein n=1 Tax=Neisseria sp. Ec49-e6-T10 TaxID=3140744 RepID=UPI003EB9E66E
MNIYHFKANKILQPYISRYWVWEGQFQLPCMLPGTGAELIFLYGAPISLQNTAITTPSSKSMLLLPRHKNFTFKPTKSPIKFIAIRFRHNALRHFCAHPIIEMIDRNITAEDIWGNMGAQIENRLQQPQTIEQKIEILNHFLCTQLQQNHKDQHPWLDQALYHLYYQAPQHNTLDSVIGKTQVSTRYFQKIFKYNTGVSPKYFQKTARFEHIMKTLLLNDNQAYLDCVLAHGYYDQSHFIKDFKQFTGQAPLAYLQNKNNRTHFYNSPLSN